MKIVYLVTSLSLLFSGSIRANLVQTFTGEIDGALFSIEHPEESNGMLLLVAHGYRPEHLPLTPDPGSSMGIYAELVASGWTVASTSYRRNGWILQDAGQDLLQLKKHVEQTIFKPTKTFLMGNSMGGGIITWLAENEADHFDGGLALGAYLFEPILSESFRSTKRADFYTYKPKFPLLYLTNQSELQGPSEYTALAKNADTQPALWTIRRDGHVNQNKAEQLAALDALIHWEKTGEIAKNYDGTILLTPASTAKISKGSIEGSVHTLVPVYGNFISTFVAEDMERLGVAQKDSFLLQTNGQSVEVLLGSNYNDVPVKEWVAFWDANGYLLFCRNYADAVETLGIEVDQIVSIRLP